MTLACRHVFWWKLQRPNVNDCVETEGTRKECSIFEFIAFRHESQNFQKAPGNHKANHHLHNVDNLQRAQLGLLTIITKYHVLVFGFSPSIYLSIHPCFVVPFTVDPNVI